MFNIRNCLLLLIIPLIISCKTQADKDYEQVNDLILNDRCPEAITLASELIKKHPNDERFYSERGYCMLSKNNIQQARDDFSISIRINQKYSQGYYGLAMVYEDEEQFDLAEKNYIKAIEMAPNEERKGLFMSGLASLYARKKEFKKAIEIQRKALDLKDDGAQYYKLGIYLLLAGEKNEAEATWLKAVNEKQYVQNEFKHKTYYQLAKFYYEEKNYIKAKQYIEKAVEFAPENNSYLNFYNILKNNNL